MISKKGLYHLNAPARESDETGTDAICHLFKFDLNLINAAAASPAAAAPAQKPADASVDGEASDGDG